MTSRRSFATRYQRLLLSYGPVGQISAGPDRSQLKEVTMMACTRFRRHRVRCFDGAGGGSWRGSSCERRAPALWRGGEVQFNRLPAGARARLDGEPFGAGLEDQRRGLLGAVDADPGAEHPAARAVATRLVRCQSEALAHYASTDWK